jgi:hypothetical protein
VVSAWHYILSPRNLKNIFGMCVLESPCAKKNRRNGVRQQPGILHGTFEVKSREKRWGSMKTLSCGPGLKGVEIGNIEYSQISVTFSLSLTPFGVCLLFWCVTMCRHRQHKCMRTLLALTLYCVSRISYTQRK